MAASFIKSNFGFRHAAILIVVVFSLAFRRAEFIQQVPEEGFSVASWNIANFGASTTAEEIKKISDILSGYDAAAVIEVSTGPAGADAVARLDAELDRSGCKWDYSISETTSGEGAERYAFFWKEHKVSVIGRPWLCKELSLSVNREPFLIRTVCNSDTFLLAVFHAVPKAKKPNAENAQLVLLDSLYESDHLLLMGDFNASPRTEGFNWTARRNMEPVLKRQKTSLKQKPGESGEIFANEYDNIWFEKDETICTSSGIINFTLQYDSLGTARKLSDHVPVWGCFTDISK